MCCGNPPSHFFLLSVALLLPFPPDIFTPLFDVTLDPSCNPKLHVFLESCVGFDMVDDESLRERPYNESLPCPDEWDYEYDPPYAHFAYYLYANLCALNKLRSFRGLSQSTQPDTLSPRLFFLFFFVLFILRPAHILFLLCFPSFDVSALLFLADTFAFRPHCGEAGDMEHLAAGFLLAKGINHGLNLQKSPALQYLYYLAQIGISMSPLSNNLLFLEYDKNPFPRFFKKGLNVTLSTDDPLMVGPRAHATASASRRRRGGDCNCNVTAATNAGAVRRFDFVWLMDSHSLPLPHRTVLFFLCPRST